MEALDHLARNCEHDHARRRADGGVRLAERAAAGTASSIGIGMWSGATLPYWASSASAHGITASSSVRATMR
jgi:hypothetical protein